MTDRISLAAMGSRQLLASGAQGKVFAVPGLRMQYTPSLVYKQYRPEVAAALDVAVLESMPAYLESLPFAEGIELLSLASWPCRLVEDHGTVTGFVMPAIPDAFYLQLRKASGTSREAAGFQHLLNDEGFLARRGISLSGRDRYDLLREAARALSVLHRHGIAVGDLSPKNFLFTLAPGPGVYFIDCGSMRIGGQSALQQAETPDWKVRDLNPGEELATTASDGYKLGLLALRMLTGTQDARDPERLPPEVPEDIRRLTTAALSPDPARRPPPADWDTPLQAAASTAPASPPQATTTRATTPPLAPPAPPQPMARVPSPSTVPATTPPPQQRTRLRTAVISTISMLAVAGVIFFLVLANPGTPKPLPRPTAVSPSASLPVFPAVPPAATLTAPGSGSVDRVAFAPGGTILAAGDANGRTYLWDTATGKLTATLTDPGGEDVTGVAFTPDGTTLATGDYNGSIYLWNTATGKLTATLTDPDGGGVTGVAFTSDGTTLATGDNYGSIYLWDTATGKLTATLTDPSIQWVYAMAFAPGGTTLATGDRGGSSTDLWDTATGKLTATFTDPGSQGVYGVAFTPDGTTLATGDGNGSIYLWHISKRAKSAVSGVSQR